MKEKILLEIQASVREEGSISRKLSRQFIDEWYSYHPNIKHVIRDVGINPPAHPTELQKQNHKACSVLSLKLVAIVFSFKMFLQYLIRKNLSG